MSNLNKDINLTTAENTSSLFSTDLETYLRTPFSTLFEEKYLGCEFLDKSLGIYHYEDVCDVFKRKGFSAIAVRQIMNPPWVPDDCQRADFIISENNPACGRHRALINGEFTMKHSSDMENRLFNKACEILAKNDENFDFITEFSFPYFLYCANEYLGFNLNLTDVKQWIDAIEGFTLEGPEYQSDKDRITSAIRRQRCIFRQLIAEKRKNTGDDFISKLIAKGLDDQQILNSTELAVSAHFHLPVHLLSRIVRHLIHHNDEIEQLRYQHEKIELFVEECLRLYSPVHFAIRETTREMQLPSGLVIPEGVTVRAMISAANQDPTVFKSPSTFNPQRGNNHKHLTFGLGGHSCMRPNLARQLMVIAVDAIVTHISEIRLQAHDNERIDMLILEGVTGLPVSCKKNQSISPETICA